MSGANIGIIGAGIAGLSCAHYLCKRGFAVTVYEAEDYIGGHTHTVDTEYGGETARIDTGFIVFNDRTYPNFIRLLDEIGVDYQPTEMSFSVRNDAIDLEYNGSTLPALFAQRANLLRPAFWRMLADIVRFNRVVRSVAAADAELTIGDYLERSNYSPWFRDNYLLPMISAIWSMGLESSRRFPLGFFVRFFENHGLLDLRNRPQWYTIKGGSSSYVGPLTAGFADRIRVATPVRRVRREEDSVRVVTDAGDALHDEVVFACHGDQALALLAPPNDAERDVLPRFGFAENRVVLHTDSSHLPRRRAAWASWNYRVVDAAEEKTTLTYDMNILQRLRKNHTYLVTLNQDIDEDCEIERFTYSHPMYAPSMLEAQAQWDRVSGVDRIHYCGAYWFNGFHEDGVKSGLRVCEALGGNA